MTIILPKNYHARQLLEQNRITCISEEKAERMDIRPLRIGILNIMPEAKSYEFSLLHPLGHSVLQIIPVWIKLRSHEYKSAGTGYLENVYRYYDDVMQEGRLDGMIITGAPVEKIAYEEVRYWNEIQALITRCKESIPLTLGICWGALAMAYVLGMPKQNYEQKLFGVFETQNLDPLHPVMSGLDDVFWFPQSRFAGIDNHCLEEAARRREINLLAYSPETGYSIFESADQRFLMNLGHFEYETARIIEEMQRDAVLNDVSPPRNFNPSEPINRWRGQRNAFFSRFIRCCYEYSQLS